MFRYRFLTLVAALGILTGCQSTHRPTARLAATQAATRPAAAVKPMIDFSRGAAGFPLAGKVPLNSKQNFVSELTGGYAARVKLSTSRPSVIADGKFPNLDSVQIDLSDGTILTSYRPTSLKSVHKFVPVATIKSLTYIAQPLHYDDAAQSLKITASNVKLSLIRGKGDKAVLVMTDASRGHAEFYVSLADLSTVVRDATDDNASRAVFFVRDTRLTMSSDNPRSLAAAIEIRGFWLLIPTTLTMTGRIDVDNDFNATLSHLSCTGSDVGGKLLAGFIDASLKKHEGKTMPLAAFPGDKLKMQDLRIRVDDALHIDADFGD